MTVRYRREGLRIVRVDGAAPLDGVRPPAPTEPDYRRTFHEWATGIRAATGRAEGRFSGGAVTPGQVRRAREVAGIGQRDLAAELRIARSSIADCEGGRRRVHPRLAAWTRRVLFETGAK
jgi:hypothetical protein